MEGQVCGTDASTPDSVGPFTVPLKGHEGSCEWVLRGELPLFATSLDGEECFLLFKGFVSVVPAAAGLMTERANANAWGEAALSGARARPINRTASLISLLFWGLPLNSRQIARSGGMGEFPKHRRQLQCPPRLEKDL